MAAGEKHPEINQHIDEEHARLHDILGNLRSTIDGRLSTRTIVANSILDLRGFLHAHFAREESDGYFSEAVAVAPRLKSEADRLQVEHAELLKLTDSLCDASNRDELEEQWWADVLLAFNQLASRLGHHEQEENALIQEAYMQDTGTGD